VLTREAGGDVAELPAVGHDRFAEVGPALLDVGDDPRGDGGAGLRAGVVGHGSHDGGPAATRPRSGRPACRPDPRLLRPYRRAMILPGSWAGVLEPLRPVFARRGTFVVFSAT
jgi:hypothetical protein